jgi:hypothetical protein
LAARRGHIEPRLLIEQPPANRCIVFALDDLAAHQKNPGSRLWRPLPLQDFPAGCAPAERDGRCPRKESHQPFHLLNTPAIQWSDRRRIGREHTDMLLAFQQSRRFTAERDGSGGSLRVLGEKWKADAPQFCSFASMVISAFSTFDTGQPLFAAPATLSKACWLAPGTLAVTSR